MDKLHDQVSKEMFVELLSPFGIVETEHEVRLDAQTMDITFIRRHESADGHPAQSFMNRLLGDRSIIEVCSEAPRMRQVRAYIRKQYAWGHVLEKADESGEFPWLWIVAAGEPRTMMQLFAMKQEGGQCAGIYHSATPGNRLGLIVLPQLPRTRETTLLRILGRGRTQEQAIEDLEQLSEDAWEQEWGLELLVRFRLRADSLGDRQLGTWSKEFVMRAGEILQKERQEGRKEGLQEGRKEGAVEDRRRSIIELVELRHDKETAARCAERLQNETNLERLIAVFKVAATAESGQEFLKQLNELRA